MIANGATQGYSQRELVGVNSLASHTPKGIQSYIPGFLGLKICSVCLTWLEYKGISVMDKQEKQVSCFISNSLHVMAKKRKGRIPMSRDRGFSLSLALFSTYCKSLAVFSTYTTPIHSRMSFQHALIVTASKMGSETSTHTECSLTRKNLVKNIEGW